MEKMNISIGHLNSIENSTSEELISFDDRLQRKRKGTRKSLEKDNLEQAALDIQMMIKAMLSLQLKKEAKGAADAGEKSHAASNFLRQSHNENDLSSQALRTRSRTIALRDFEKNSDIRSIGDMAADTIQDGSKSDISELLETVASLGIKQLPESRLDGILRESASISAKAYRGTSLDAPSDEMIRSHTKFSSDINDAGWTYNFRSWGKSHAVRILPQVLAKNDLLFAQADPVLQPATALVEQRLLEHGCRNLGDQFLSREKNEEQGQQGKSGREQSYNEDEH